MLEDILNFLSGIGYALIIGGIMLYAAHLVDKSTK